MQEMYMQAKAMMGRRLAEMYVGLYAKLKGEMQSLIKGEIRKELQTEMHAKITEQQASIKKQKQDVMHAKIAKNEKMISDLKAKLSKKMQAHWTKWRTILKASGKDATKSTALILKFADMEKKRAFLAKRAALKGGNIYLDEDLTPAQVAQKEHMPRILDARKEG